MTDGSVDRDNSRMIDPTAYIAQGAIVLGDVLIGRDSSIWFNSVLPGIPIGSRSVSKPTFRI